MRRAYLVGLEVSSEVLDLESIVRVCSTCFGPTLG